MSLSSPGDPAAHVGGVDTLSRTASWPVRGIPEWLVAGDPACPSSLRHFLHPPAQVETSGPVLRCKQKAQVCFCCKSAHSSIAVGAFLLGGSFLSWCKTLQGSSKTRNSLRRKRSLIEGLHRGEQKTGALYPPASSHILSIARKLGHNVLILFHNIPSSLPQLV